jgi:chorismate dehydratase
LDQKIRVGAVSYLNTKPLLYGIERSPIRKEMEMIIDYPASIATMLLKGEIDMGLVPVAIIPQMNEYYINGRYCIGSNGDVASVCIFSESPIEKVKEVLLDYQSRTSVQLARLLLKEYWKISPRLTDAGKDFREHIKGTTAGVVIGDRALEQRKISPYIYDLAGYWKAFTGLPFVFAAWISNRPIDPDFIAAFDEANGLGVAHIEEVLAENPYSIFPLRDYYTIHLDYHLDSQKVKGLGRFLQYLKAPAPSLTV